MKNIYVIALAAILFQGCGQKKEMTAPATRPVKTTIVESRSVIRKDFSGIVEAVEYVKLAFRVSGQIISLPVIEGEKVKKGQLIAAIDPRDIALQYAATKSAYETASAQVERNKRLLSRQAISVQEYEISLSNYQKAKSEYELSSNNMRDTKLTAPFDGSIEKRLVENYQRVNSGEGSLTWLRKNEWIYANFLIGFVIISYLNVTGGDVVNVSINQYGHSMIGYFLVGTAGSLLCMKAAELTEKYLKILVKPLAFVGRHTLPIMCWHLLAIEVIKKIWHVLVLYI